MADGVRAPRAGPGDASGRRPLPPRRGGKGRMRQSLHDGEKPPSDRVIDQHREMFGRDYRLETEGPHPVEEERA